MKKLVLVSLKNNKSEKEAGQKLYENNTGIH